MQTVLKLIIKGIKDLGHNKWEQLLTLAAVTLVIFLGGMLLLAMHNIHQYVLKHRGEINFEIYWQSETSQEDLQKIKIQWAELQEKSNLTRMDTYTPQQAMLMLEERLNQELELGTSRNPLPPTAILGFKLDPAEPEAEAKALYQELKSMPLVQEVKYNPLQIDLAHSWISLTRQILWPFVIFLTLLVGLILGNTFKLAQMNRKEEIEVLQLVGAANWYIQLPLLVGGGVQALLGSGLALGLLRLAQDTINNFLHQPPLWLELEFLNTAQIMIMLIVLGMTGIISSWVAVRK